MIRATIAFYIAIRLDEYFKLLWASSTLTRIHQSHDSCPMDRFDKSFHSYPMDGSDESNHLCSMDQTRPVLISFPNYCGTKFSNRTGGVNSTVLDNLPLTYILRRTFKSQSLLLILN